jgi:hypothetical protein
VEEDKRLWAESMKKISHVVTMTKVLHVVSMKRILHFVIFEILEMMFLAVNFEILEMMLSVVFS